MSSVNDLSNACQDKMKNGTLTKEDFIALGKAALAGPPEEFPFFKELSTPCPDASDKTEEQLHDLFYFTTAERNRLQEGRVDDVWRDRHIMYVKEHNIGWIANYPRTIADNPDFSASRPLTPQERSYVQQHTDIVPFSVMLNNERTALKKKT